MKHSYYPIETNVEIGYSIISLAFTHDIKSLGKQSLYNSAKNYLCKKPNPSIKAFKAIMSGSDGYDQRNDHYQWQVHDYLLKDQNLAGIKRHFSPDKILTPSVMESCFGSCDKPERLADQCLASFFNVIPNKRDKCTGSSNLGITLRNQSTSANNQVLTNDDGKKHHQQGKRESTINTFRLERSIRHGELNQEEKNRTYQEFIIAKKNLESITNKHIPDDSDLIDAEKAYHEAWHKHKETFTKNLDIEFSVEWVDLWYFDNDVAILSFKCQLADYNGTNDIGKLTYFNKLIRNFKDTSVLVSGTHPNDTSRRFWQDIVIEDWLIGGKLITAGFPNEPKLRNRFNEDEAGLHEYIITHYADNNVKYAKVMTFAKIPSICSNINTQQHLSSDQIAETENKLAFNLNAPEIDPPIDFTKHYEQIMSGDRPDLLNAYQRGSIHGYPTKLDYLLFDLATSSMPGAAAGDTEKQDMKISPEYLRYVLDTSSVDIWECWRGLSLPNALAFLSYHEEMDIQDQIESRYYFLYVYHYHIQFKLNLLSEGIIDNELNDLKKTRKTKNEAHEFINQYWFNRITIEFQDVEVSKIIKLAFNTEEIFETVRSEIEAVSNFIDDKINKGKETLLTVLLISFYPILKLIELIDLQRRMTDFISGFSGENTQMYIVLISSLLWIAITLIAIRYMDGIKTFLYRTFAKIYNK